jgi:hypothetical protein
MPGTAQIRNLCGGGRRGFWKMQIFQAHSRFMEFSFFEGPGQVLTRDPYIHSHLITTALSSGQNNLQVDKYPY